MKKFSFFKLFTTLLVVLSSYSCNIYFPPYVSTLPPETQEGYNTFGCYIDGKLFVSTASPPQILLGGGSWEDPICRIVAIDRDLGYMAFYIPRNVLFNNNIINQNIIIDKVELQWVATNTNVASIIFTKIQEHTDEHEGIVSGRFAFELTKADGTVVKVTDGRFDMGG